MRRTVMGLLTLLLLIPAAWALDDKKDKDKPDKKPTPTEDYQGLVKDFQKAQQDAFGKLGAAKTDEDRFKISLEAAKLPEKFAPKFLELAEKNKNPKDSVAIDALLWIVQNADQTKEADKATELIISDHLKNAKVRAALQLLGNSQPGKGEKLLRAAAAKADDADTRGQATYALAQYLKNRAELPGLVASLDEVTLKRVEQMYGKKFLDDARKIDGETLTKEAETLLETVEKKFADVKLNNSTLGALVKPTLFEMRHLSVGKEAPDIDGEDLDGKKFKLSDYRGKVLVLDFWGNW